MRIENEMLGRCGDRRRHDVAGRGVATVGECRRASPRRRARCGRVGTLFALVLLAIPLLASTEGQLPPEILVDRFLVQAARLIDEQDHAMALDALDEVLALERQHGLVLPEQFHFQYAQVAFSAGSFQIAMDAVDRYFEAAGTTGELYQEALELWSQIDAQQRATTIEAEARRQQETEFWESVRESTNPAELEAYLARWPDGVYAPHARTRMAVLRQDLEVFRDCPDCPEMVAIPAGEFWMGSGADDEEAIRFERPRHRVSVGRFALARYEVTRAEYGAFVSATGHSDGSRCWTDDGRGNWEWRWRNGASWRNPRFPQGDNHPVVCVNWEDAQSYVQWLSSKTGESYRLPSEAEWEYAARAGTEMRWYWANSVSSGQCGRANGADASLRRQYERIEGLNLELAISCDDGMAHTALVGSYEANVFGLFDMLGNVSEWTEDCWHENYARAPSDGSAWTRGGDCGRRVKRGGSWYSSPQRVRSARRVSSTSGLRNGDGGFRVSRTLD